MKSVVNFYRSVTSSLTLYLEDLSLLLLRLIGAKVFFESGLTKWNGWFDFNEQKYDLFLYELFCPDPVREGALLLCNPETLDYEEGSVMVGFIESLAFMAGVMEIVLPALLVLGLFTRVGALGLLGMTLFIQLAVFPTWGHWWNPAVWWAVVLFAVFARGPGLFSIDRLLGLEIGKKHSA
jgi:putative oxidoreductase